MNKKNLSSSITALLTNNPQLLEVLEQGLGNITAVAKLWRRELESLVGSRLSINTISMAIRRNLASRPAEAFGFFMPQPFAMAIRNGIYEVAYQPSAAARRALESARKATAALNDSYFSTLEGQYEIVVYVNQKYKSHLKRYLKNIKITSEVDNLACVSCNWATNTKDISGIYYRITRALAVKDISIQSFHTIGAEMSIFVKADKILAAHQALQFLQGQD